MKIILAPDSFKGNLTSLEVAIAFEKGIKRVLPRANCIKIPMADGGEGTVQSLIDGIGGEIIRKRVIGPIGQKVFARYGLLSNGTAVIEMAEASGLPLVTTRQKNPTKTTTFGTGELIIDAINKGAKKIIIGIGGSATNDGGVGMAQALGVRFLDSKDKEIKQHGSGGMLKKIVKIDTREANKVLKNIKIIVACDVDSPLCGRLGASYIFGPQKGATPAMVRVLDDNLKHLAKIIKQSLKKDISKLKGAGAAGGLGAGLVAFAKAKMKSGVDIVIDATNLERHMKNTNLVITGEGRVDSQTAYGKTPSGVAKSARKHGIPTLVIGGGITDDAKDIFSHGIDALESACARDMSLEDAIKHSREHLANAAERAIRLVLVGKKITKK